MIKLFTHTDLDGIGCAILAKIAFGDEVDVEYCNYNDVNEKIKEFMGTTLCELDKVYITDISVHEEVAEEIDKYFLAQWRLFDHHATAEWLNKYSWAKVRTDRITFVEPFKTCGTELFYEHLMQKGYIPGDSKMLKEFVGYVRDYDTWRWKELEHGGCIKGFNDLLYILGREEFIKRCVSRYKGRKYLVNFTKDEQKMLDKRQAEIDAYIEKKMSQAVVRGTMIGTGDYYKYAVVFADRFVSELGNRLCESNDTIDCAMIIDMGARKVSYRSVKPDVDVSKFAAYFGGGGHKAAAGNYFNEHALMSAIGDLEYNMYNPTEGLVKAMTADTDEQIEKPKKKFKLFGRK